MGLARGICIRKPGIWHAGDRGITVMLTRENRKQFVSISVEDDECVFRSTVLGSARVTGNVRRWRELTKQAWQRNAEHDLVAFGFDRRDCLIGEIRVPAATLDKREVELYVNTLAIECDRFEYVLTGQDVS